MCAVVGGGGRGGDGNMCLCGASTVEADAEELSGDPDACARALPVPLLRLGMPLRVVLRMHESGHCDSHGDSDLDPGCRLGSASEDLRFPSLPWPSESVTEPAFDCHLRSQARESTEWRLLPASWRELKWQWQCIRSSINAVDSEERGPATGVQRRCLSGTTGRHALSEQAWSSTTTAAASADTEKHISFIDSDKGMYSA